MAYGVSKASIQDLQRTIERVSAKAEVFMVTPGEDVEDDAPELTN